MPHPSELDNIALHELVERAHDEIRRLCCGPRHEDGRAWTMCIPAQSTDSDLILSIAIHRQAKAIADAEQRLYETVAQLRHAESERDEAKAQVSDLRTGFAHGWAQVGKERADKHRHLGDAIAEIVVELAKAKAELARIEANRPVVG